MSGFSTPTPIASNAKPSVFDEDDDDEVEAEGSGNNRLAPRLLDRFARRSSLRRSHPSDLDSPTQLGGSGRRDHMQKLYYKKKSRFDMIKDMLKTPSKPRPVDTDEEDDIVDMPTPTGRPFRMSSADSIDRTSLQQDDSLLVEIKREVGEEGDMELLSERTREMLAVMKDFPKLQEANNRDAPLEVRMENFSYTALVDADSNKVKTVFNSSILYPIYKWYQYQFEGQERKVKELKPKQILADISLLLKPGRSYLVLGPPGCGKTTLLRAISGRLHPKKDDTLEGSISYNGRELKDADEFIIDNAFGYISQLDKHAPRLTVEETFEFAFQCKSGGVLSDADWLTNDEAKAENKRALETRLFTNLVLAGLGLTEVKSTFVGSTDVRGVSGGQRRRVTVGEMFVSRVPVLCCDEISTGLDAASTYDMTQMILHFGRLRKHTRIVSLLQPSPETCSLFDEVIVMSEGHILYCGPIVDVENYFGDLGYVAPEFMDVADFVQMVSTAEGASLYDPPEKIKKIRPDPPTPSELAQLFRQSRFGMRIRDQLVLPPAYVWKETDSAHGGKVSSLGMTKAIQRRYANSFGRSMMLILKRFFILWTRDKRVIIAGAVKNILMGMSVGGVFFDTDDPISIQGALFQAGLFIMLGAMQAAGSLVEDRIVFYKHHEANFYSAWPFVFGRILSQVPQTILDTLMFGVLLYYTVGLGGREEGAAFLLKYLSILIVFALLMTQQLAVFASFATTSMMQAYSACIILLMMLFGGFIVAPDSIPKYYYWAYAWNPFAWMYRSLVVLEFRSARWEDPDALLSQLGFGRLVNDEAYGDEWFMFGYFYMIPYLLLCCALTAVGLTTVRNESEASAPMPIAAQKSDEETEVDPIEIPFKPVTLSFHDIVYEVTASTKNEKLTLLKGVNGIFRSGRMCALMGTSGAGKTTLMDVIALRKRTGTITGDVLINGWQQEPVSFRRMSGYVEQFDVQTPQLTVKETVLFSARLRLDPELVPSDKEVKAFVDYIMREVELSELSSALVGTDETGGLSFEQKKRLSIAVELAASPSLIFLDEPTSGLDARSALLVVKTLKKIAAGGRTVCATIHQPSSTVFDMFDDLLLLKKGGQVVYHGELGTSCETLVSYFETNGAPPIDLGENPADWMLRVMSLESMGDLAKTYQESEACVSLKAELNTIKEDPVAEDEIKYETEYAVSGARRQDLVNRRLRTIYWRSPTYSLAKISVSVVIAFVLGSIFVVDFDKDVLSEIEMRARLSVIFLSFVIVGIMAIVSVLPVMTMIRDMYYRHNDAGMYGSGAIGSALGVAEKWFLIVSALFFTLCFLSTSHIAAGQFSARFWGYFCFNIALYSYFGQAFVCLVKPKQTAFILASVFIGINNFFSGLIVRPQFMLGTFFALPYAITPGRYVYEGLVMAVYNSRWQTGTVVADDGSEYFIHLNCTNTTTTRCEGTYESYVDYFFGGDFTGDHDIRNVAILGGMLVIARLVTWLALHYIRYG